MIVSNTPLTKLNNPNLKECVEKLCTPEESALLKEGVNIFFKETFLKILEDAP